MSEAAALQTQTSKTPPSNSHSLLVQRNCACGGSSGLTGSCSDCEKKKLLGKPLQTKLRINEPGDEYEQEADRVAEQVMRMPDPELETDALNRATAPIVQRKVNTNVAEIGTVPAVVGHALSSSGQQLDAATRAFFEPRFGHNFDAVRIHTDPMSERLVQSIGARAFTLGRDIFFGVDEYEPASNSSMRLLGHELTHVMQQGLNHRRSLEDTVLFRSSEPGKSSPDSVGSINFSFTAETSPTAEGISEFDLNQKVPTAVIGAVFAGDVFNVAIYNRSGGRMSGVLQWLLPPELELVHDIADHRKQFRVVGKLAEKEMERRIEIGVTDGSGTHFLLIATLRALPTTVDVRNRELVENARELANVRSERGAGREGRAAMHEQKKALKERRRELKEADTCELSIQNSINHALSRAIQVANAAIVKLTSRDSAVQNAISQYMNWSATPTSPSPDEKTMTKIIDILTLARNTMSTRTHKTFVCVPVCEEESHAARAEGNDRDSTIELCPLWYQSGSGLRFPVASDLSEATAYALLHEFVHLSGPYHTAGDEIYVESTEWESLDFNETLQMADSYASVAWVLGSSL